MSFNEFKLKWENYWYHYKGRTWVAVFVLLLVLYSFYEASLTSKKDVAITYMGCTADYEKIAMSIEENFSELIEDYDKDGKKKVLTLELIGNPDTVKGDMLYWQRVDLNIVNAESYLYFVDESFYELLKERNVLAKIKTKDGEADYIDVTGNKYFKDCIYGKEKLFLCIRKEFTEEIEASKRKSKEMSKKILEKILETS